MKHSVTYGLVPGTATTRPIRARVSWAGHRLDVRLGVSYDSDKWQVDRPRKGSRSSNGVTSSEVLRIMQAFSVRVDEFFDAFAARCSEAPSVDEAREALDTRERKKKDDRELAHVCVEEFARSQGRLNSWSDSTYKKFTTLAKHLRNWQPRLAMDDIDRETLEQFVSYLHTIGIRNTTISKYCGLLRWWLGWCEERGISKAGISDFRPKLKGTDGSLNDIVYLEREELTKIMEADVSTSLSHTRDIFLLQCWTGLRYSDIKALRKEDVGTDYIRIVTAKTSDPLIIDLNSHSREIFGRFDFLVPSNQVYNRELKVLGHAAGLTRTYHLTHYDGSRRIERDVQLADLLTTHTARRTFVVLALSAGIPSEVIRSWTGHKSEASMKPYYKIVDSAKARAMARLDSIISEKVDPKK